MPVRARTFSWGFGAARRSPVEDAQRLARASVAAELEPPAVPARGPVLRPVVALEDPTRREADGALMEAVAEGDREAFMRLMNMQSPRLLRFTASLLGNMAEAEELVQEAFLRLWQRAEDWRPDGTISTWLHRVTYRLAVDAIRRRRPSVGIEGLEDVLADAAPGHDEQLALSQESVLLRRAIDCLPERQKAALLLCHFQELGQAEAASIMGIGEHAYESLLARARRGLREALNENGHAHGL